MIKVQLSGEWARARRVFERLPRELPRVLDEATGAAAGLLRDKIKAYVAGGVPPPLRRPRTSGGNAPLYHTKQIHDAIEAVRTAPGAYEVGIRADAGGHGGNVAGLAAMHEQGITILQRMTDKQRRYLFGVLFRGTDNPKAGQVGQPGLLVIVIPPRPFMQPVWQREGPRIQQRLFDALSGAIGQIFEGA